MSDWTAGYVADVGYTYGYYPELNPARVGLALLHAGIQPPSVSTACELGYGQGISVNLHAAGSDVRWYGTDFNPAQAGFAQSLAGSSGADLHLVDQAFDEFCTRLDLPDFDFIGLHGIWSWISDDNRRVIVEFIRRKLKVGGVLYISYNTLPGWSSFAPMRHLMTAHADVIGAEGHGIVSRINGAIAFAESLLATKPLFARANPSVADRLQKLKDHNRHYLAHEYFNRDWHPMHFATMAEWLAPAKLQYACSAHYLDHIDALNLSAEQQTFLKAIPDPVFRESVRDFMVNQQFRRDYWIKGARRVSGLVQLEQVRSERVMLVTPAPQVSFKVNGALGEASLSEAVYQPIVRLMADHQPRTLGVMEKELAGHGVSLAQLVQAVMVLVGASRMVIVQSQEHAQRVGAQVRQINAHILKMTHNQPLVNFLGSPLTGGGLGADRFIQMFLMALSKGHDAPEALALHALETMGSQNQRVVKEGKTLETRDENLAELTTQAKAFAVNQLPVFRALQVI